MTKISLAIATVFFIMLSAKWVSDFVFRDAYPDALAIDVPGFEGPVVNRATLQRSWPEGLGDLGARAQLRAHMGDVENSEIPAAVASLASAAPAAPEPDLATLLASADVASGERRARTCSACHTFNEGGRDGVGPNLWAVLGDDIAARASYDYSDALAAEPGSWTFEKIDAYLLKPETAVPGNKMAFPGVRRAKDRADIIAYLRMQGAANIPLPEPAMTDGG